MAKSCIASYQMQDLVNNNDTIKALSLNHCRRSAVEGPLSKEHRSSEAHQRQASLLVNTYIYMQMKPYKNLNLKAQKTVSMHVCTYRKYSKNS